MNRLVIDTNSLIRSVPRRSPFHDLWLSLFDGRNYFCVTNEILEEYAEIISIKASEELANNVIKAILNNPYTLFITPYYSFNLITKDQDDNKFVDCAIAGNARFVVTNDHHFNELKDVEFPKVDIISLEDIMELLT